MDLMSDSDPYVTLRVGALGKIQRQAEVTSKSFLDVVKKATENKRRFGGKRQEEKVEDGIQLGRSRVFEDDPNPVWNDVFEFKDVTLNDMVEIKLYDYDEDKESPNKWKLEEEKV